MAGKTGSNATPPTPHKLTNSRPIATAGRLIHSTRLIHTFITRGIIKRRQRRRRDEKKSRGIRDRGTNKEERRKSGSPSTLCSPASIARDSFRLSRKFASTATVSVSFAVREQERPGVSYHPIHRYMSQMDAPRGVTNRQSSGEKRQSDHYAGEKRQRPAPAKLLPRPASVHPTPSR